MIHSKLIWLLEDAYHIYEEMWSSLIGEELVYYRDTRNHHDPFAVATYKGMTVVRHVHSLLLS